MAWAALRTYSEGGSIGAVESSLLGSLIVAPYLRLGKAVTSLRPEHFSSPAYGAIFEAVMRLKHPEAVLVAHDLDANGVRPPRGSYGWGTVINAVLDDPLVEDDAVDVAAKAIRSAAFERSVAAREGGAR
jgi:replicative DNA helicase